MRKEKGDGLPSCIHFWRVFFFLRSEGTGSFFSLDVIHERSYGQSEDWYKNLIEDLAQACQDSNKIQVRILLRQLHFA
jgi:hypothetical protein